MKVAERLLNLSESQTIAMSKMARELKEAGKQVISLSLGEPDFNTPDEIKAAAKQAIDDNYSHYTAVAGDASLLKAIQLKFKRDNGLDYNLDQIVSSTGAKQSIVNVLMSIVNPGDEVILPTPYWVSYLEMIKLAEGTAVQVEGTFKNGFKMVAEDLRKALTPKTKALFLNSPSNPTGAVYSKSELLAIADVLKDFPEVIVISDEIYEHINYVGEHVSIASLPGMYDRTVTINGVSKAYAMTGWRLGYIGAPRWIAQACIKMQGQVTSATCSITQQAARKALELDPKVLCAEMVEAFERRRALATEIISEIPGLELNPSDGAFYLFPKVSNYFGKTFNGKVIENATDLSMYLLEEALVACVTGDAFGAPECIRLSYATSDIELKEACIRISKAFKDLA